MLVVINQMADIVWLITTRLLRPCELVSGYHTSLIGTLLTNSRPIALGIKWGMWLHVETSFNT